MNVLLSVKPQYANAILDGTKKFEFRKSIFVTFQPEKVFIYASSPQKEIIGYFTYSEIKKDTPEKIWRASKKFAGIDEATYFNYFRGRQYAIAIKIASVIQLEQSIRPSEYVENFIPPQSFYYLKKDSLISSWIKGI